MAKILLIKCNEYAYPNAMTHPLGLMYLSSYIKREGAHDVRIIDTRLRGRMAVARVCKEAEKFRPDIIGLGALMVEAPNVHATAGALRKKFPRALIVAGGPYPSSCSHTVLKDDAVDCAVIGEGEITFAELVKTAESGGGFSGIAGMAARRDGEITVNPPRAFIEDLDTLPFPDWDAVDVPAYFGERRFSNMMPGRYMTLFTSRSCPFNCIYCHKIFGKKYRARGPEKVVEEIEEVNRRFGISEFEFVEDTFGQDRERAAKICDLIAASGRNVKLIFPNGLRADMLDEELIRKLKAAGTAYIAVAIETASPRLQKLIRKNLNLERAREVIAWTARAGIYCHGFFMLGFPTETEDEMKATVRFACRSRLHTAAFFMVNPFPGTELHDMVAGENARPGRAAYSYYSLGHSGAGLPAGKVKKIYTSGFVRFYLNPARMIRIFMALPDKRFIFKNFAHSLHRIFLGAAAKPPEECVPDARPD